mmetsp:Transcript_8037/g.14804  ORF Transcript_8037/g.14804 Transcript_8037/m.14804 type:complete len:391 (+) Transcript_8037:340-1512(+)
MGKGDGKHRKSLGVPNHDLGLSASATFLNALTNASSKSGVNHGSVSLRKAGGPAGLRSKGLSQVASRGTYEGSLTSSGAVFQAQNAQSGQSQNPPRGLETLDSIMRSQPQMPEVSGNSGFQTYTVVDNSKSLQTLPSQTQMNIQHRPQQEHYQQFEQQQQRSPSHVSQQQGGIQFDPSQSYQQPQQQQPQQQSFIVQQQQQQQQQMQQIPQHHQMQQDQQRILQQTQQHHHHQQSAAHLSSQIQKPTSNQPPMANFPMQYQMSPTQMPYGQLGDQYAARSFHPEENLYRQEEEPHIVGLSRRARLRMLSGTPSDASESLESNYQAPHHQQQQQQQEQYEHAPRPGPVQEPPATPGDVHPVMHSDSATTATTESSNSVLKSLDVETRIHMT